MRPQTAVTIGLCAIALLHTAVSTRVYSTSKHTEAVLPAADSYGRLPARTLLRTATNSEHKNALTLNALRANGLRINGLRANGLRINGIRPNGFRLNGLNINGLNINGVRVNGTAPDALAANSLALGACSDTDGTDSSLTERFLAALDNTTATVSLLPILATQRLQEVALPAGSDAADLRELLAFVASCALNASQSLTLRVGETKAVFAGDMGLAPEWASGPLTGPGQEMVSACLLARVNYFEAPLVVSLRGAPHVPALAVSDAEARKFTQLEGAFWGNLFLPAPEMYACGNAATALNSYRHLRVCSTGLPISDGYASCGPMRHVGECGNACAGKPPYESCGKSTHVVTVYLPG